MVVIAFWSQILHLIVSLSFSICKREVLLIDLHVNAINSGISLSDDQGSSATAAKDDSD